jgi:hypothetical protein
MQTGGREMKSFQTTLDLEGSLMKALHTYETVGEPCQRVAVLIVPVPDGMELVEAHKDFKLPDRIKMQWKRKEVKP